MIHSEFFVKTLINIALVLIIIPVGFILHVKGKPYNSVLFAIHKLLTVGFIIFMAALLTQYLKVTGLNTVIIVLLCLSVIAIIGLLVSGALLSIEKLPVFMLRLHNVSCIALLLFISGIFYRLLIHC
jgi:hypothetical protein